MRILRRLRRSLANRRMHQAHKAHRVAHEPAYSVLDPIIAKYRANGGLDHPWQHYKLYCLNVLLQKKKPTAILELGSGTTTAIFSNYARNNPGATVTVVDESRHWLQNAHDIAGIGDCNQFSLLTADSKRTTREAHVSYEYDWINETEYDFIFVDGPSHHGEKSAVSGNIFDYIDYRPDTIVVDGRRATAILLKEKLTDYKFQLSEVFNQRYYPGYQYFSVFSSQNENEHIPSKHP